MEGRGHEWKKDVIHLFLLFVYNLWRTCFWVMITGFSSCSFLASTECLLCGLLRSPGVWLVCFMPFVLSINALYMAASFSFPSLSFIIVYSSNSKHLFLFPHRFPFPRTLYCVCSHEISKIFAFYFTLQR